MQKNSNVLVIAHRGSSGNAPENTLAAIKLALLEQVDMVEIDVHLSKDGVPVVIHDDTLDRTTDGFGKVKNYTIHELKQLNAGSWFSEKFSNEKIPTLKEVLDLVKDKCQLLIEIKHGSEIYPNIEQIVLSQIFNSKAQKDCIIQSFDPQVLHNLFELNAQIEIHKLVEGKYPLFIYNLYNRFKTRNKKLNSNLKAINPCSKFISKKFIKSIHRNNKKCFTWTVNHETEMLKLIKLQVDGIITNYPNKLRNILNHENSSRNSASTN